MRSQDVNIEIDGKKATLAELFGAMDTMDWLIRFYKITTYVALVAGIIIGAVVQWWITP